MPSLVRFAVVFRKSLKKFTKQKWWPYNNLYNQNTCNGLDCKKELPFFTISLAKLLSDSLLLDSSLSQSHSKWYFKSINHVT